jgi:hypothetical protein
MQKQNRWKGVLYLGQAETWYPSPLPDLSMYIIPDLSKLTTMLSNHSRLITMLSDHSTLITMLSDLSTLITMLSDLSSFYADKNVIWPF